MNADNPGILLVNPTLGTPRYENEDRLRSYLSLGSLASALRNKSFLKRFALKLDRTAFLSNFTTGNPCFQIRILNLSDRSAQQSIFDYFAEFVAGFTDAPLIVGMTATSAQLDEAAEIARAARDVVPTSIRVIGGAHVSVAAADYLNQSLFQVACIGEGVETVVEIALRLADNREIDLATIAGIVFKDGDGRIQSNPLRMPLLRLDDYPFPSDCLDLFGGFDAYKENNRHHVVYILAGYGCPHDCIFCAQRTIHGSKIRERSAKNIFEEISKLVNKGFRKFAFVQETFLNRERRIADFCRLIADAGLEIEWTAEARADQLSHGQLELMQTAGLRFIQIGVESGDPALLSQLGKNIDLEQVVQLLDWCRALGINTTVYLLVGLPGQGWQSVLRSAVFFKDHPPYNRLTKHASVAIAIPYPGTRIELNRAVRITAGHPGKLSWPNRNPTIQVNQAGEFVGEHFTATDDMMSEEILEAWLYLDDFCHFLLHAVHPAETNRHSSSTAKSMEYAGRMFYMIQRRTIRELIVRAQTELSADRREAAFREIVRLDNGVEKHFKDVTGSTEPVYDIFVRFLSAVQFENGFDTMKMLSIGNRIKWMKICALVWHLGGRQFNIFRFSQDQEKTGIGLDKRLHALDESRLNRYLNILDAQNAKTSLPDIVISEPDILAFGLEFCVIKNRIFQIGTCLP